jgi:hypothetical protein
MYGSGGAGVAPPNPSDTTAAAVTSPPMQASATSPSSLASAHASEVTISKSATSILGQAQAAIKKAGKNANAAAKVDATKAGQLLKQAKAEKNPYTARKLAAEARASAAQARGAQAAAKKTVTKKSAVEHHAKPKPKPTRRRGP